MNDRHFFLLNTYRFFLTWVLCLSFSFPVSASSISKPANCFELNNKIVSIVISESAELLSCVNRKSGKDIASHELYKIAKVTTTDNRVIKANKASYDGELLRITFDTGYVFLAVDVFETYITFEVVDYSLPHIKTLEFLDLRMKYDYSAPDVFLAVGIAMTLNTDPVFYPSGESQIVRGRCMSHTGIKGAKLAFVACEKKTLRDILKKIYKSIPQGTIPISENGGPFALDSYINKEDCVILNEIDPFKVNKWADFYSQFGIRQFDFHHGPLSFTQGQFSFSTLDSAERFKQHISDPLYTRGIISSLHTYSHYISYDAEEILRNPKWQQQLEFLGSFTLAKSITHLAQSFDLKGDISVLKKEVDYRSDYSPYILIDEEIIKYKCDSKGIVSYERGQCGTKATSHKAGTVVRIIGGRYFHIAPQPGSELFYEIAHRTADVYNRGGFRGLYFDALEGLIVQLEHTGYREYMWYYVAGFINEVLRNCKESPIVEYSSTFPTIWSARGRGGAWDTPNRGYKSFIDKHIQDNLRLQNYHYVTTLGWFNLFPKNALYHENGMVQYVFSDVIDYLGMNSIAFDQTMVYSDLKVSDVEAIPALKRNLDLFSQYGNLRRSSYFSEPVKETLRKGAHEYKLMRSKDKWGFVEAEYCKGKLFDIEKNSLRGTNPFKHQKPFIRLMALYTSDGSSPINLIQYRGDQVINERITDINFPNPLDLTKHKGVKVSLKGNGEDSEDSICLRFLSSNAEGYADYIIPLSFDGWRDIVLSNIDNAEYDQTQYHAIDNDRNKVHRKMIDYSRVKALQIFLSNQCKEVEIRRIDAVPLVKNVIANPMVTVGNASVLFIGSIKSGEYIEYSVGNDEATIYDGIGNSRAIKVEINGKMKVPKGDFSATVSGSSILDKAPSSFALTLGFYGKFIHN